MSDGSISFKDPLFLAIEAGQKTKTRRLVRCDWQNTVEPKEHSQRRGYWLPYLADGRLANGFAGDRKGDCGVTAPWSVGDRLWVKQRLVRAVPPGCAHASGCVNHGACNQNDGCIATDAIVTYGTDGSAVTANQNQPLGGVGPAVQWPWKPRVLGAMYCPRWASRLTVEVTDVRVERLCDISEADAWAEGIEAYDGALDDADLCRRAKAMGIPATEARVSFAALWDSINAKKAPWSSNPWVWVLSFRRAA